MKARLTQVVASPAGFEGRAWVREVVEALRAGGRFLGDSREGRIVLVPYGEQVFTAAEEIVRLAFRRARPIMVRSLDAIAGQFGKLRATQRVPRFTGATRRVANPPQISNLPHTQPSQPVERHNGRMGFAARLPLLIAAAVGLLGAQSGAPAGQIETAPNLKALMARGVQAYDARNDTVALGVFRQAAIMGDVDAMMYLGVMYGTGRSVNVDYASAMAWFRHAADADNSQAMCNIGLLYLEGLGLPKSYREAMTWFGKAASFGNAEAMFNVGVLYRDGLGSPVNYAEAMKWFRRAAGAGEITAANAVGVLYQQGLGVPVDYAESMSWYRRAADAGNDTAMYNVGVLWEGGLGITANREQAILWYRKAAAAGNEPAKAALKSLGVKD